MNKMMQQTLTAGDLTPVVLISGDTVLTEKPLITNTQKKQLRNFISVVVTNMCGSKSSKAFRALGNTLYSAAYHSLYDAFGISRYDEIPIDRFKDALAFINQWQPDKELKEKINEMNEKKEKPPNALRLH